MARSGDGKGKGGDELSELKQGADVGRQTTGVELGERFKAAWELAAVMGQVQVYGWQTLIVRCTATSDPYDAAHSRTCSSNYVSERET